MEGSKHLRQQHCCRLQLVLTACFHVPILQTIMKSQTTTTEEDIHVPVVEQREPWTLPGSIFKPRVKESDARAFYDGAAVRALSSAPLCLLCVHRAFMEHMHLPGHQQRQHLPGSMWTS